MTRWLLVFLAAVVVDFIWARYTAAVTSSRAIAAAWLSIGIIVSNAVVTVGYVTDYWLIVPTAAGAWCGTYFAIRNA